MDAVVGLDLPIDADDMAPLNAPQPPQGRPPAASQCRLTLGGAAGLAGATAYSSFLLARPLGSTLDPVNSYVSELGVRTQPASTFFRASDVVAGLLIVLLGLALRGSLPRDWRREAAWAALVVAGAASSFDGWQPMGCAPSVNLACRLHEDSVGLLGQLREPHTISSVTGIVGAIASMLLVGSLVGECPRWRRLGEVGQLAAAVVTVLSLLELPLTLSHHWVGLVERAYVLCVSGWVVLLAVVVLHAARDGQPDRRPPKRAARRVGRACG